MAADASPLGAFGFALTWESLGCRGGVFGIVSGSD